MDETLFKDLATRYGMNDDMIKSAWDKTRTPDRELHIKKFKMYLMSVAGEANNNFSNTEGVLEDIAVEIMAAEFTSQLTEEEQLFVENTFLQ